MKTTKQIQKTVNRKLASATIAVALTLTSIFTYAQSSDHSKHFSNRSLVALAMHSNSDYNSGNQLKMNMPGTQFFNHKAETNENTQGFSFDTESESDLRIEAWMISNKYFTTPIPESKTDKDKPLEIEGWMTDKQVWNK